MFEKTTFSINETTNLHALSIKQFEKDITELINENIVKICEGNSSTDIDTVKQRIKDFLEKKDLKTRMGAIAEFFVHLYLNSIGYKQECLFFNLEENSIKKGFDGYYSKDSYEWIMESKSGSIATENLCHGKKVKEAYYDLKKKIAGDVKNNPWRNAYNHASQIDVNSKNSLRSHLKALSDAFTNKIFSDISNFNVIPCSTIFLNGVWIDNNIESIKQDIEDFVEKLVPHRIEIICIYKLSINLFIEYLGADFD